MDLEEFLDITGDSLEDEATGANESDVSAISFATSSNEKRRKDNKNSVTLFQNDAPLYDLISEGNLHDGPGQVKKSDDGLRKVCFNCEGDHNVSECPSRPDYTAIARNRKKFMGNRISNVRYHEENSNLLAHLQPGKYSTALRDALGLRPHEVPEMVYRMRFLGYPPGWLKDAEVRKTDVNLYDGIDPSGDGEIESDVRYNVDKLVSFPGFNVPLHRRYRDEWQMYDWGIAMQAHHDRQQWERVMLSKQAVGYRKRKMAKSNCNESEIESKRKDAILDEDRRSLGLDYVTCEIGEVSSQTDRLSETFSTPTTTKTKSKMGKQSQAQTELDPNDASSHVDRDFVTPMANHSVLKHHGSASKNVTKGAVIGATLSPFLKSPQLSKFSEGITDIVLHEETPEAVGIWKNMGKLMGQVREFMNEEEGEL